MEIVLTIDKIDVPDDADPGLVNSVNESTADAFHAIAGEMTFLLRGEALAWFKAAVISGPELRARERAQQSPPRPPRKHLAR
jgi:hypothetical protein